MKKLILVIALLLTGCATPVPIVAKFPPPPGTLVSQKCPNLNKLNDDTKLSDVSKTVTNNYTLYYECAVKLDAWIEWYQVQKTIFENVK
jgi:hypothetical protein